MLMCTLAARTGHTQIIKWLRARGFEWSEDTCAAAVERGHTETLQWLISQGCPVDEDACAVAVLEEHESILQWLTNAGFPWESVVCASAASAAKDAPTDVLLWLRNHGFPWRETEDEYGDVEIMPQERMSALQQLVDEGCCQVDEGAVACATAVLRWLETRVDLWEDSGEWLCIEAAEHHQVGVLAWLIECGCMESDPAWEPDMDLECYCPRGYFDDGNSYCSCLQPDVDFWQNHYTRTVRAMRSDVFPRWYCAWCPRGTKREHCTTDHKTGAVRALLCEDSPLCRDTAEIIARIACA